MKPSKINAVEVLRDKMKKLVCGCEAAVAQSKVRGGDEEDDEITVPDMDSVHVMSETFECIAAAKNIMLPTSVEFDYVNGCIFLVWESDGVGHLDLRIDLAKSLSISTFRWCGEIPEHQCRAKQDNLTVAQTAAELAREVLADIELRANKAVIRTECTQISL
jgi:hypothetical protein